MEERACARTSLRLKRRQPALASSLQIPASLPWGYGDRISTQAALGRFLSDLKRAAPEVAHRVVTCSPDVASSTNLGGWINKTGVWSVGERQDWLAEDLERILRWIENSEGQHIELGIAESNLGGPGLGTRNNLERWGRPLIPIATMYDPFVASALEPWSLGMYAGGQSIRVGTPSGVTLAPEGGAQQSITTPSIGLEQPECTAWEPAFAQDLEWCMLETMSPIGIPGGRSAYFRLTTRPLDQAHAAMPTDAVLQERRRRHAVAGGYRLTDHDPVEDRVTLVGVGAMMPKVIASAARLKALGIMADVVCLTSPDLVFESLQRRNSLNAATGSSGPDIIDALLPRHAPAPLVTVQDAPHTLSFLAGARGDRTVSLGVKDFGQSSDLQDASRIHGIDEASIVNAALNLVR